MATVHLRSGPEWHGRSRLRPPSRTGRSLGNLWDQWSVILWPALLAAVGLAWLVVGVIAVVRHWAGENGPFQASAGVATILSAAAQLWVVRQLWTGQARFDAPVRWRFYGWFFVGIICCYLGGVALGPDPAVRYLVRAAFGWWYSVSLVALSMPPAWWPRWRQTLTARLVGRTVVGMVFALVAGELALRGLETAGRRGLGILDPLADRRLPAGTVWHGHLVNSHGYWNDEFRPRSETRRSRVAVFGDSLALAGPYETNCLTLLRQAEPGVELYNFGLPELRLDELGTQAALEVPRWQPDLAIVCLAVTDDLTRPARVASKYDWREVRLLKTSVSWFGSTVLPSPEVASTMEESGSYEQALHGGVRRLAVCRKPLDAATNRQWSAGLAQLDQLVKRCQKQSVPVALVLVPADFQVSSGLTDTLARRAGWPSSSVDVDMPQRRLARFAQERNVACLDLLPYLRSASTPAFEVRDGAMSTAGRQLVSATLDDWLRRRFAERLAAHSP